VDEREGREMTDIELKLISHPAIQGRRGEWQGADWYWCSKHGKGYCHKEESCDPNYYPTAPCCKKAIRLPLPIDPNNPERGCWGMVDWNQWEVTTSKHGLLRLWNNHRLGEFQGTPTEALLRAVIAQEEGK
jgi:hypothetical protein